MSLQDLTPQLRTRLSRVERLVGLFVSLATLLMLIGFGYYLYHTAKRKGWLVTKVPYYALLDTAEGLKVGNPVRMMGFDAGEITQVEPMPPDNYYRVYIALQIRAPYYGYIWTDSEVRVGSGDLLGNRYLEVTKGGTSGRTNYSATYKHDAQGDLQMWIDAEPEKNIQGNEFVSVRQLRQQQHPFKGYQLIAYESPAVMEQVTRLVRQVETALPNILALTNQIAATLTNATQLATTTHLTVAQAQPILTNLNQITDQLRDPQGSLGKWLIPPQLDQSIQNTLSSATSVLKSSETNLNAITVNLNQSLANLALMTSNLNAQVQANSLILSEISSLIQNSDELIQGLQRHWLLKGAFRPGTPAPLQPPSPSVGGEP